MTTGDAAGRGTACAEALVDWYCGVRALTDALSAPLSPEDQSIQSMPDVSPTKWHRAHTTWFFETFLLSAHCPDYRPVHPTYGYLFNSYYDTVGPRYPRNARGLLSRPGVREIGDYRREVDSRMVDLLASTGSAQRPQVAGTLTLGLHHEQQHQELLLMDIKHVLSASPVDCAYSAPRPEGVVGDPGAAGWLELPGGIVEVGHAGGGFSFDNEGPRHRVLLEPFAIADRLVTNGDWMEFMEDGGYSRHELWLSDGWALVSAGPLSSPMYWWMSEGRWWQHTLSGCRPVESAEPVCHVTYFEADAYARWAGARLPTEFEWEHAADWLSGGPDPAPEPRLHPRPPSAEDGPMRQAFGDVWQWTASAYIGYPRYAPPAGAVGEYNGKFMSGQMVLRGSSALTPGGHARTTYRNFFPPASAWMMSGLRLATSGAR